MEVFIVGDNVYKKEYSLTDQFGESSCGLTDKKYKSIEEAEQEMGR